MSCPGTNILIKMMEQLTDTHHAPTRPEKCSEITDLYIWVDGGYRETLTSTALSWSTERAKIPQCVLRSAQQKFHCSFCICSFTLSPVLPHLWAAEEDQCMIGRTRWWRREEDEQPLQDELRGPTTGMSVWDRSLKELLNGEKGCDGWEFAWFLFALCLLKRVAVVWMGLWHTQTLMSDVLTDQKLLL